MRHMMLAFACGAAALAASSAPARAAAPDPLFRVAVPIGDLDLSVPAHRAALRERVRQVATATCARHFSPASGEEIWSNCIGLFDDAARKALGRSRSRSS
jgi:UrcA family protein